MRSATPARPSARRRTARAGLLVVVVLVALGGCGQEPSGRASGRFNDGSPEALRLHVRDSRPPSSTRPRSSTTTVPPTTAASTTVPPTTAAPTTAPPTTAASTTVPPTTAASTTAPPTTAAPTTPPLTAVPPTTVVATTAAPVITAPPATGPSGPSGVSVSGPLGPPWPTAFTAADAIVARVPLYQAPGQPMPDGRSLANPTWEGLRLVFLVREESGEWLHAQIPARPNGATAWVKRSDVATRIVPNHVVIERSARRVTVYHGDQPILSDIAAMGKASSPTPLGSFFVDGMAKPNNPNGPYGAYQVSFTGFSEVYSSFGGGIGQVAMHGTNQPALLGTPASHGCVRLSNETITRMVELAPSGTPVDVVP